MAELAMRTWANHLAGLRDDEIERGLFAMVTKNPEWPPTLGQFIVLCRGEEDAGMRDFLREQREMLASMGLSV